jgi:filamentous hemagglutinin
LTAQDEIGVDASGFTEKHLEFADGSKLDLTSTTSGGIGVTSKGSVELVDVDTKDGSIVVGAEGLITATDVLAEGSTADAISLSTTKDGVLATKVISADSVTITATTGGVTATSVTAGNDVSITASSDIIGTSITAGDEVSITTSLGDVTVGTVTATGGTLEITATTGSINDASNDNDVDLNADGLITLTAEDEIGEHATFADKELELAAGSSVNASSTTVGAIRLDGLGDLTLNSVESNDGSVIVNAIGLITATSLKSGGTAEDIVKLDSSNGGVVATSVQSAGAVSIDARNGEATLTDVDALDGNVVVTATGNIFATQVDAADAGSDDTFVVSHDLFSRESNNWKDYL